MTTTDGSWPVADLDFQVMTGSNRCLDDFELDPTTYSKPSFTQAPQDTGNWGVLMAIQPIHPSWRD